MDVPEWHQTSYDSDQVVNLRSIAEMPGAPEYAALRSYATGRREHALYGPMPAPVARIANRRLWLAHDVTLWLTVPIPVWQRSRRTIAAWVASGRPRRASELPTLGVDDPVATMPHDDGRLPATP